MGYGLNMFLRRRGFALFVGACVGVSMFGFAPTGSAQTIVPLTYLQVTVRNTAFGDESTPGAAYPMRIACSNLFSRSC